MQFEEDHCKRRSRSSVPPKVVSYDQPDIAINQISNGRVAAQWMQWTRTFSRETLASTPHWMAHDLKTGTHHDH
jgi:hypothetical protein